MVEVSLCCAIVGKAGGVFGVKIDNGVQVWELQDAIKAKKPNDFKDIDADKLQLFLAKTEGGAWLDGAGAEAVALDERGHPQGCVQMDPTLWIKNPKHFGDNFQPGEGQVHVLVVVPKRDGTSNGMSAATTPLTVEQVEMSMNKVLRERDEKASAYSFSDLNTEMEQRIVKKMRLTENVPTDIDEPEDTSIPGYMWIPEVSENGQSQRTGTQDFHSE
ncbi:unnamed protein product [Phytophthora lilii]|uniref:Unnamed protein product n=1 Tax=Phytophthora lilii TaxID=2077276 RepID=A0A9W7CTV4_9STRA|nr:unnamed protein product [Phytophthora lilii]